MRPSEKSRRALAEARDSDLIAYWCKRAASYYERGDHRKAHDCAAKVQEIREKRRGKKA